MEARLDLEDHKELRSLGVLENLTSDLVVVEVPEVAVAVEEVVGLAAVEVAWYHLQVLDYKAMVQVK